jgi:beta-N-acetylglucosaminidase
MGMDRKNRYILLRIVAFLIVCIFLFGFINVPIKNAASQITSTNINQIDTTKYPGIKEAITSLKVAHPNWNFKLLYTGLDWNDVIQNEYKGHSATPTNLVPANSSTYNNNWICSICGKQVYDTGEWHCASESAIKYMMDPRNFLDDGNIFQFLELTYTYYNYEQVKKMVAGTFLDNVNTIDAIINSAKTYNVNAYYIIARLIQEQGKSGNELTKGQGYNEQYVGYYNVFNIGATGNTRAGVITNGLKRAQKEGWTSLQKSIAGGTKIIAENYIAKGQNTLYFQKFDVENSDGSLYTHQYMQNILAAKNEASRITKVVKELGTMENSYNFIIPVYENMPEFTQTEPNLQYVLSDDLVKINVSDKLRVRNAPNGGQTLGWLNRNEIVTRVEMAQTKVNGTYWDKVKSSSGILGYVARETYENGVEYKLYLVPVESIVPPPDNEENNGGIGGENNGGNNNGDIENDGSSGGGNVDTEAIKVGDVNNDGKISPTDYVLIKNHIMQIKELQSEREKKSADVNKDGKISPTDYVLIKNHIMHGTEI